MKLMEKIKFLNAGIALGKRDCGVCQNLTDDKRGQGSKTAEIYCGTEENAEFLIDALGQLGIKAECEIFTTDGEFMLEVRL